MSALGKIGVVGSGAIGCFYGSKLIETGHDVHFLMRSDLEIVRRQGLTVRSSEGDRHFAKVQGESESAAIGPCDVVLVGLKATANEALRGLVEPLLHAGTKIVTLQNGLGSDELLGDLFGRERVLGGLCFVCLNRTEPGVIEHYGHGTLSIGALDAVARPEAEKVAAAYRSAGIEATPVENLAAERWRKLVWNVPFNGLSIAAGGVTVDTILADPALEKLTRELMLEVIAAANALGFSIEPAYADFQIERSRSMGAYRPSSLIDWEAGRPVEVEAIWGEPLKRAQAARLACPRLEFLTVLLRRLTA